MTATKSEGLARLRDPFEANQIGQLPKPYRADSQKGNCAVCKGYHGLPAAHLDYVGHAALTDRLLEVDPAWSWEPMAQDPNGMPILDGNGGLWIRLTVLGVTKPGYGDAQGKKGGNAVKEAIGDALRNAGMRFGAALDLWHKGDLHDVSEAQGREPAPSQAPAEAPDRDALVAEWSDALSAAATLAQLQAGWDGAGKAGVANDPRVIAVKDKRKAELA